MFACVRKLREDFPTPIRFTLVDIIFSLRKFYTKTTNSISCSSKSDSRRGNVTLREKTSVRSFRGKKSQASNAWYPSED
jgi:hypothetical protein